MTAHEWEAADTRLNAVVELRRDRCRLCGATSAPDHNVRGQDGYRLVWMDEMWKRCPDTCEETAVLRVHCE